MVFVVYLVLAALVVGLSIKLSEYVDLLDKMTNLSGAFIGGVMLAAVTSLPELFTSISSTLFLGKSELVLGNILGSNIFNATILGVIILFACKRFANAYVAENHLRVVYSNLGIYMLLMAPIFFGKDLNVGGISLISWAVAGIYIVSIKLLAVDENQEKEAGEVATHLSKNQVYVRFVLCSVVLVGASIGITYTTDLIATALNLEVTLAGALLLGVATSLPEVTSCMSLVKLKNFNAAVGNILGSNLFNFFILFLGDVLYRKGTIYTVTEQSYNLVLFGLISMIAMFVVLKVKNGKAIMSTKMRGAVYVGGGLVSIVGYMLFLTLSQ
jgi:cation:H+ antiporter